MEKNNLFAIIATILLTSVIFFVPNSAASEELTGGSEPIHLNMKEMDNLSPETWGDNTRDAIKDNPPRSWEDDPTGVLGRTREWKDVGTWTSTDGNVFDISLTAPVNFNLWWREVDGANGQDDSYDAQVQYRFRLNIDGQEAAYYTDEDAGVSHECAKAKPCEWTGDVGKINITSAPKGTTFAIEIEYWSFSDIEIYYDNSSFNSGVEFGANAIKFGNTQINGQEVNFNFVQAWDTEIKEAISGDFITLMFAGVDLVNNEQKNGYPKIEEGKEYDFNGTKIKSIKITWYVEDKYAKLDQGIICFSLSSPSSSTPQIKVNVADILIAGSGTGDEEGFLGGFEVVAVISALIFTSFIRRKV